MKTTGWHPIHLIGYCEQCNWEPKNSYDNHAAAMLEAKNHALINKHSVTLEKGSFFTYDHSKPE